MNQRELNSKLDQMESWQQQLNNVAGQMALAGQEVLMEHIISINADIEFQKSELVQCHGAAVAWRRSA